MPTYMPPTRKHSRSMHPFDRMRGHDVGQTLLLEDGAWRLVENVTAERMAAAQRAYRGGYVYTVTVEELNEIPVEYGGGTADMFVDMFEGIF